MVPGEQALSKFCSACESNTEQASEASRKPSSFSRQVHRHYIYIYIYTCGNLCAQRFLTTCPLSVLLLQYRTVSSRGEYVRPSVTKLSQGGSRDPKTPRSSGDSLSLSTLTYRLFLAGAYSHQAHQAHKDSTVAIL